jgi:hypothetical protein
VLALIQDRRPFKVFGQPLYHARHLIATSPGDAEHVVLLKKAEDETHIDGTLRDLPLEWLEYDITAP